MEFITNILQSSTEYSVVGKDLTGKILLWNEGARRLYGYDPEEVVGKANAEILHVPEDIAAGRPRQFRQTVEAATHVRLRGRQPDARGGRAVQRRQRRQADHDDASSAATT